MNHAVILDKATSEIAGAKSRVSSRMRAVSMTFASIFSGCLIGFAWSEGVPALLGIVGLGIFFALHDQKSSPWLLVPLSLFTGSIAGFCAAPWISNTAAFLTGAPDWLAAMAQVAVSLFLGLPFLIFTLTFLGMQKVYRLLSDPASHAILTMPCLWVLCEVICPNLFPLSFGYLISDFNSIAQLAEIFSVLGLAFLAANLAIIIPLSARIVRSRERRLARVFSIITIVFIAVGLAAWGNVRILEIELASRQFAAAGKIQVMLVQAETESKHVHRRLQKVSRNAAESTDLILWPEASIGNYHQKLTSFRDRVEVLKHATGIGRRFQPFPNSNTALLAGGGSWIGTDESRQEYVSAFLIDESENVVGRHDKIELMPYGETIPGETWLPFLRTWFGHPRILQRGKEIQPIGEIQGVSLGTVLCCEDMFPHLFRKLAQDGADVMISLGNGMAFDSPIALRQHFRIAKLRSIETRKYFVRCMSRGVSGVVAPNGEVIFELPCMADGALVFDIPKSSIRPTPFVKYGNGPIAMLMIAWIAMATFLSSKRLV